MPILRARWRASRWLAPWLLSLGTLSLVAAGLAQEPAPIATVTDDEPAALDSVAAQPVATQPPPESAPSTNPPEIPETVVTGRPGIFPANPLPSDQAITPTRTETRIGSTGAALTVITQEEIQQSGQSSVAEVLRGKVGLDIVRSGGPGGQTSLFMRGANSAQTKVMLDGIPLNDPSSASRAFDFSTLDVENVERIEVLRGPQSLLYGSDAIGGVVNIITARGQGPTQVRASAFGGSFGTGRVGVAASGGDDRKYFSLAGSYLDTDGISQASSLNGNIERDGFQNGTFSGRVGITASETLNVDYVFRYIDSKAGIDDFNLNTFVFEDMLNAYLYQEQFVNRIQVQSLFLDGGVEQVVAFSLTDYARRDTSPNAFTPQFDGQARVLDYQLNFLLTERNTLSVGAQYYAEEFVSTNDPFNSQFYRGAFAQDQWQILDNWYAGVGVRYDEHSRAGPAETYRANSLYTILLTDTDVHGSIGTGFRAPALAEFAFSSGNLLPERSKGWDVGATQHFLDRRASLDVTYFRNDFQDLIDFNFNTFLLENIGLARSSGVEATAQWQVLDDTRVTAAYTYTEAINLLTQTELLRRPRDKYTLAVDQYFHNRMLRVGAQVIYVGPRADSGGNRLAEYTLLNLNGSLQLTQQAELFARIDNTLNERYVEVANFGTPGVAGYAGVNVVW